MVLNLHIHFNKTTFSEEIPKPANILYPGFLADFLNESFVL
jgi:hypothetical protein